MDTRHFLYAFAILVAANVVSEIILRKLRTPAPVLAFSKPSGCGCGG